MTGAPDTADAELLAQFTRDHSEAAFVTLVERHLGFGNYKDFEPTVLKPFRVFRG